MMLRSLGRVFSGDKVVESHLLNVLGAQVFRTIAARSIYNTRRVTVGNDVKEKLDTLERDGSVVWPDFLLPDHFEQVKRECFELVPTHSETLNRMSGANTLQTLLVRKVERDLMPSIHRFLEDRRLREILEGAERRSVSRPLSKFAKIERLTQREVEDVSDPQSEHHSDTFFNCHKAWLYVTPVSMKDGPLTFSKGTHKLTTRRLGYIYKDSCTEGADASRRVTEAEMAEMQDPMILTCPANTLVVANVCGYHSRLQGDSGAERWAVKIGLRADPFRTLSKAKSLTKAKRERSQA